MSFLEPPPSRPGDDLDGLLRAFFRRQMPHPWPAAPRTPSSRPAAAPRPPRALARSRWALAASIGLLLLGSLLLPGRLAGPSRPSDAPGWLPHARDLDREDLNRDRNRKPLDNKAPPRPPVEEGAFPDDEFDLTPIK